MGEQTVQYSDAIFDSVQLVYGRGFLSQGGPAEVAEIVKELPVAGCAVLDVGCGLGGATAALAGELGAASVTAIDVESEAIARTEATAEANGVSDRITPRLVEPGPLPFPDHSFDLVFSKDVIAHIPDKGDLYREIFRVLKPGGWFAASDWHKTREEAQSDELEAWTGELRDSGLWFEFTPVSGHVQAMIDAGFGTIAIRDRSDWAVRMARDCEVRILGPLQEDLQQILGTERAEGLLLRTRSPAGAMTAGALQHCHLRAGKPEAADQGSPGTP